MKPLLTDDQRLERMRENMLAFPGERLQQHTGDSLGVVSICGFGPSLADTWGNTIGPIMTTSGAHDFMLAKGVVPTYHVEADPREHKAWIIDKPHPDCTYLICSQCHPAVFEKLRGYRVVMWHAFTNDERQVDLVESLEPGTRLIGGGTNTGMRSILVARELGHTHFELHAMDCSYRGKQQWAGDHFTAAQPSFLAWVDGEEFETSTVMLQSTDDFFNAVGMLPHCPFRVHGDGLLSARLRLYARDPRKAMSPQWFTCAVKRRRVSA